MSKKKNIQNDSLSHPSLYSKVMEYGIALSLILVAFVIVVDVNDNTILKSTMLIIGGSFIFALWIYTQLRQGFIQWNLQNFQLPIVLYFLVCCVSLIQSYNVFLSCVALIEFFMILVLTLATSQVLQNSTDARQRLTYILIFILAGSCIAGIILQMYSGVSVTIIADFSRQLISTFGNTAYFGGFLAMMIPFALGQIFASSSKNRKILFSMLTAIAFVMLIFTRTRSAWIATGISIIIFVMVAFPRNKKMMLYFVGICVLLFVAEMFLFNTIMHRFENIFQEQSSFSRRLDFYQGSLSAFLSSPVLGNGFGAFEVYYALFRSNEYWISKSEDVVAHAHNEYLEILSESGIIGMGIFLVLLFIIAKFIFQKLYQEEIVPSQRFIIIGIATGVISLLIDNIGNMSLRVIPIRLIFFIMIALLFSYQTNKKKAIKIIVPPLVQKFAFIVVPCFAAFLFYFIPKEIHRFKADRFYLLGYRYDLERNTRSSFSAYQEAYKENPEHPLILFHCAGTAFQTNNMTLALQQSDELLQRYPGYPKANLIQALTYYQTNEIEKGIRSVKKEITLRNHPQTYLFLARMYEKTKDTTNEIQTLKKLIAISLKSKNDESVTSSLSRLRILLSKKELQELPLEDISKTFPKNNGIKNELLHFTQNINAPSYTD